MANLNKEQFFIAIEEIAKANKLKSSEIDEILKEAVTKSFHSKFDPDADLEVLIDRKDKEFKLINKTKLVIDEKIDDEQIKTVEISLEDALKINPSAKVGDLIAEEVSFDSYSRAVTQQIKQLLIQKIKEIRKTQIYSKHKGLVGEMVEATVISSAKNFAILSLIEDGTEAFMPGPMKNPRVPLAIGENVSVYVEEVLEESKAAQIIVSNSSPSIVRRVLEQEVPEIMDGSVEIKSMSRIVGERTKIAVFSTSESIDPVGAIIGAGGDRINKIVNKIHGEKIDVIRYSDNLNEFVASAISPAKAVAIINKNDEEDKKIVIVPNRQHTLAIGRRGSNAKLVAELCKVRIDILSLNQAKEQGIEFKFNGNISESELEIIESGQKLQRKTKFKNNQFSNNYSTNINFDDVDQDIESFKKENETNTFIPIENDNPIFSDDELKAMESEFELDSELADFADIDLSKLEDFENE
ncbi:MAG: transcription termination factor NusA [Mycoplasma sp.]|nr:transcription termination factor NusA [Mycoplasma sp.]